MTGIELADKERTIAGTSPSEPDKEILSAILFCNGSRSW
jgi:hypothetical protein